MPPAAFWALRLIGPIVYIPFGIDQLNDPEHWLEYIPKWMHPLLINPVAFMRVHATLNIILALWLLSGWYLKIAAGFAVVWMATIIASTFLAGKWRIGLRDLAFTLGLLALTLLL